MIPIFRSDWTAELRLAWRGKWLGLGLATAISLAPLSGAGQAANPYRGLWVGQVTLTHANEVSVPLDKNNIPIAPDPKVPTPAHDPATLRLILHVSGAGQVGLLKDVAILNRNGPTNLVNSESDIALVTDETLYGAFPPQPAQRIASAVFDFGDSKTTEAVDAMVDAVVNAVTNSVQTNTSNLTLLSGRVAAQNAATLAGHRALGWEDAGTITAGARADLVTVRLDSVRTAGFDPAQPAAMAVFAATAADVTHVVVDGRVVVRGGVHGLIDDVPRALAAAISGVTA